MSSPFAGALMRTFWAPASRCAAAFSRSVNRPVDSITISAPELLPRAGWRGRARPATAARRRRSMMPLPPTSTMPAKRPWTESYFSRWASVAASSRSLTPTKSMSAPVCLSGPEEVAADTSEAVHADLQRHGVLLEGWPADHASRWAAGRRPGTGPMCLRAGYFVGPGLSVEVGSGLGSGLGAGPPPPPPVPVVVPVVVGASSWRRRHRLPRRRRCRRCRSASRGRSRSLSCLPSGCRRWRRGERPRWAPGSAR